MSNFWLKVLSYLQHAKTITFCEFCIYTSLKQRKCFYTISILLRNHLCQFSDVPLTSDKQPFHTNNIYKLSPLHESLLDRMWFPAKGFVTILTWILEKSSSTFIILLRSLPCSNSMMDYEALPMWNDFLTFISFIRYICCAFWYKERFGQSFPTLITPIRFLSHVNSLLSYEVWLLIKGILLSKEFFPIWIWWCTMRAELW